MDRVWMLIRETLTASAEPLCVVAGVVLLNTPALILRAEPSPGSLLYNIRSAWPFNTVNKEVLNSQLSLTPQNLKEGRWHTLVTSLFNHTGPNHLASNVGILCITLPPVLKLTGVLQFVFLYITGGVVGNVILLMEFITQRSLWRETLPNCSSWWPVGEYVEAAKQSSMNMIYNAVNDWRPVVGASGCVTAVLGFYSTAVMYKIWNYWKTRNCRGNNELIIYRGPQATFGSQEILLPRDAFLVCFSISQVKDDLSHFINDFKTSSESFVGGVVAYSKDGVAHGSHFGGFMFGVFFSIYFHRRNSRYQTQTLL